MRSSPSVFSRLWTARGGAALVLALAGASCSSAPDPYPTVDAFCAAKAEQECQVAAKCAVPTSACTSARISACTTASQQKESAGRKYTSSSAQKCIDVTRATYATGTIAPSDQATMDDACERVFAGAVLLNLACTQTYDCTGTYVCDKGHCAQSVTKNLGDGCANPGETCATGSYCTTSTGGVVACVAKAAKGEACSASVPCAETLRCSGVCVDRFGIGEACTTSDDCSAAAPYCDPNASNKCDAGKTFGPGSALCKDYGAST